MNTRTVLLAFTLLCISAFFPPLDIRPGPGHAATKPVKPTPRTPVVVTSRPERAPAAIYDTIPFASYTFDDGLGGPDPQGWTTVDLTTNEDTVFHIDDFAGLSGGYTPLQGAQSLWCGLRAADWPACIWVSPPGYGDHWRQNFESIPFSTTGNVYVSFLIRYDTETGWDVTRLQYLSISDIWQTVASWSGTGDSYELWGIPADSLSGTARIRFQFDSDGNTSDRDGSYDSDGAVIIDSLRISDGSGLLDYQDFESESPGDLSTSDGHWTARPDPGFGDYAALFEGDTILQEDSLVTNETYLWGFFNGSPDHYGCAGHPEQPVVPYGGDPYYIWNEIRSPFVAIPSGADSVLVEFDIYRDLPLDPVVFYVVRHRFLADGCPTEWEPDDLLAQWGDQKDWHRYHEDLAVVPLATHVQVGISVWDGCEIWCGDVGSGACHSHAPLIDNVELGQIVDEIVVTNTSDGGVGSLRQAILDADADGHLDAIVFDIPGAGPHTIQPLSALPSITYPVIIDGYTQPGASPNTNPIDQPINAVLKIIIDGTNAGGTTDGLFVFGGDCVIKGLVINNFGGNGINLDFSSWTAVEGNFIGTDVSGTAAAPNGASGVRVGVGWQDVVGGNAAEARNLISGNGAHGVQLGNTNTETVAGNFIGTDRSGSATLGNTTHGVAVEWQSLNALVGENPNGAPNVIAFNGGDGVWVERSSQQAKASVSSVIHSNGGLGIDVGNDGVSPNPSPDSDQDYPVLTSVVVTGESTAVDGTVAGFAETELSLEFFANGICDSSGYGEGERYLGSTAVVTDISGTAVFGVVLPQAAAPGEYVTATATAQLSGYGYGITSEFSQCVEAINTPTGNEVAVDPVDESTGTTPVTLTFDEVTAGGNTTLEITDTGPAAPGTFAVGDPPTYYNLSTTATFTDSFEICIEYDEANITGAESGVRVLHWDTLLVPDAWVDITTSRDTVANVVCGKTNHFSPFLVGVGSVTGILEQPAIPERFALHQNVPNPFNPATVIRYDVPEGGAEVTVAVYDVAGRLVRTLVDGFQPAGRREVGWEALNDRDQPVASGIYFCRMSASTFVQTRKMVLLR